MSLIPLTTSDPFLQVSELIEHLGHLETSLQVTSAFNFSEEEAEGAIVHYISRAQATLVHTHLQSKEKLELFQKIVQVSKKVLALLAKQTTLLKNKQAFLEGLSATLCNLNEKTIAVIAEQTKMLEESIVQEEKNQRNRIQTQFSARFPGASVEVKKTQGGDATVEVIW